MTDWNLFAFQKHLQDTFPELERILKNQQDGRGASSVSIDASQLACSFVFQVMLGLTSIHQLDQWLRGSMARELFAREASSLTGSDSTLLEAADGWNIAGIREAARASIHSLKRRGPLTLSLPGQTTVRPAALDGSNFGGHFFSVLTLPGSSVQALRDLQPYDTVGDERAASFQILRRLKHLDESTEFSHLLMDGLYMDRSWFLRGIEMGFHSVIKTTEQKLTCVKHLQALWDQHQQHSSLPNHACFIEGEDACRNFTYEALQHRNLSWQDLTLNGLMLRITYTSGRFEGTTETYFVFTTDTSLSARGLRQLAHHRWAIENNQFKELNQLVGSKASYIQSTVTKHTILFWQMIGWTLFQAFRLHCEEVLNSMDFGQTMTKHWLIQRLKERTYDVIINGPP